MNKKSIILIVIVLLITAFTIYSAEAAKAVLDDNFNASAKINEKNWDVTKIGGDNSAAIADAAGNKVLKINGSVGTDAKIFVATKLAKADYTINLKFKFDSNVSTFRIGGRSSDDYKSAFAIGIKPAGNIDVFERTGGSSGKSVASANFSEEFAPTKWYSLKIVYAGNNITVFINDKQMVTYKTSSADYKNPGTIVFVLDKNAKGAAVMSIDDVIITNP